MSMQPTRYEHEWEEQRDEANALRQQVAALTEERDSAVTAARAAQQKLEHRTLSMLDVVQARDDWHKKASALTEENARPTGTLRRIREALEQDQVSALAILIRTTIDAELSRLTAGETPNPHLNADGSTDDFLAWQKHEDQREAGEKPEPAAPDVKALYYELLYAVSRKHPSESRHQTALRYIQQAETRGGGSCAAHTPPSTGEQP